MTDRVSRKVTFAGLSLKLGNAPQGPITDACLTPTNRIVKVVIPSKLVAGDKFKVSAGGQVATVEVPPNKKGGQKMSVEIIAKPIGAQLSSIHEIGNESFCDDEDEDDKENGDGNGVSCYQRVMRAGKEFHDSDCGVTLTTIVTVGLAIVSITSAFIALDSFTAASRNLNNLISNWERAPLTGLYISNTSTCPSGYELLNTPRWPGTTSSACACADGAYSSTASNFQYSSSSQTCDSNQTEAGCLAQPELDRIDLSEWRGRFICFKREGEAQLTSSSKTRPIPKKAGVCETGYQACGDSTYDKHRTVCIPDEYGCPVTGALADTSLPSGYSDNYTMTTDDGTNWYIRFQAQNEMPINQVELLIYSQTQKRGQCFLGGENHENYGGKGKSYQYQNVYPKKCSRVDTRWEVLDSQLESDYLYENFILADSSCSNDRNTSDFVATGKKCGSFPFLDTDCMLYRESSTEFPSPGCSSDDSVCEEVYYQSNCGALTRWATESDETWAVMFRREIYWDSHCEVSMLDIKSIQKPLKKLHDMLLLNLIFNVVGNALGGIYLTLMVYQMKVWRESSCFICFITCCFDDPKKQAQVVESMNKYLSLCLCLLKLVPAVLSLLVFNRIFQVILKASEGNCMDENDKMTQLTFDNLEEEVLSSVYSLISQVAFDSFHILIALASFVFARMQKIKAKKKSSSIQMVENAIQEGETGKKKNGNRNRNFSSSSREEDKGEELETVRPTPHQGILKGGANHSQQSSASSIDPLNNHNNNNNNNNMNDDGDEKRDVFEGGDEDMPSSSSSSSNGSSNGERKSVHFFQDEDSPMVTVELFETEHGDWAQTIFH